VRLRWHLQTAFYNRHLRSSANKRAIGSMLVRMRVAVLALLFSGTVCGSLLASKLAFADAVPPPPDDCAPGMVGVTSHGGPQCVPEAPKDCAPGYQGEVGGNCVLAACASDQQCEAGNRCVQVDVCQVLRELNWTGWNWQAQRPMVRGNLLGEPPSPPPAGDPPKAWVKLNICGQDGPCNAPAECRPMGLCYPPKASNTKAKVVPIAPVPEVLPEGVYPNNLLASDPKGEAERAKRDSSGGCRRGCTVSSVPAVAGWLALPLLVAVTLAYRRRARC
jgi:hypothetical protein